MDFIIGGAYQGKTAYAKKNFGVEENDIYVCREDEEPDFTKRCLVHYEKYMLYCMRNGLERKMPSREDAVVIAEDIFCGVVSMDEEIRAWREETGRALTALAFASNTVTRIFCGLPLALKAAE